MFKLKKFKFIYIFYLLIFIVYCKKITIPDPYLNTLENQKPKGHQNFLCFIWESNSILENNKPLKAYSISRLFYSSIENTTGTLREILERSFLKKFSKDFVLIFKDSKECSCKIKIGIQKNEAIWWPPQEFIQNPIPIRKGKLEVYFSANYSINDRLYFFQREVKEFLLPQEEYKSTEKILSFIYREFIEEIYSKSQICSK